MKLFHDGRTRTCDDDNGSGAVVQAELSLDLWHAPVAPGHTEEGTMAISTDASTAEAGAPRTLLIGDMALECRVVGAGESVMLVHGSVVADAFAPLLSEPSLGDRFQLVIYHRRGYAGSTHPERPLTVAEHAADCGALMDALGIDRAHIVGHSLGGAIALQFALDAPDKVQSLTLLEAGPMPVPSVQQFAEGLSALGGMYVAGQKAEAIDAFERAVVGPDYRLGLDRAVPGWFDQAVGDADTFFAQELPAMQEWRFSREDAARIAQPVLVVTGSDSATLWPGFREAYDLQREWLPQAEGFVLPNATHGMQMQNPRDLAEALTKFLALHPLSVRA